jgi:hypothetical protein
MHSSSSSSSLAGTRSSACICPKTVTNRRYRVCFSTFGCVTCEERFYRLGLGHAESESEECAAPVVDAQGCEAWCKHVQNDPWGLLRLTERVIVLYAGRLALRSAYPHHPGFQEIPACLPMRAQVAALLCQIPLLGMAILRCALFIFLDTLLPSFLIYDNNALTAELFSNPAFQRVMLFKSLWIVVHHLSVQHHLD